MENEARFDLNRAVAAWKQELAAQPGISADDARELESHLRECLEAELRQGRTEPEAFEVAVRRLGAVECIGAEFEKVNPLRRWPHRVALMAFAGLVIWAWGGAMQTVWIGAQVFGLLPVAGIVALGVFLNGVLPLALLALVANGRAKRLLHGLAPLFSSRFRFLASVVLFGLALNYAGAWSVWNNPEPEKIFGPGGKEHLTLGLLFWQYCKFWPMWPGPLVVLVVWLTPYLQSALCSAKAQHASTPRLTRDFTYWFSVGLLLNSCFGPLSGVTVAIVTNAAGRLYSPSIAQALIIVARWMPNVVLCALAILVAHDRIGFLNRWATDLFNTRFKSAAAGILLVLLSYGTFALQGSMSSSAIIGFLLFSAFWPLAAVALIAWLTPSVGARAQP